MKVYLCARYSRHPEMQQHRAAIEAAGHQVTSRWHNGSHEIGDVATDEDRCRLAVEDLQDLQAADCVFAFTEGETSAGRGRGGRHVEVGFALAAAILVILIGPRENVFHYLDLVERVDTLAEALELSQQEL